MVDSNEVLTINEGVRIHLHWNSSLIVYGRLIINGTLENPVIFQGDRLEQRYKDVSGQWGTIAIVHGSKGNIINHAIIKNSIAGFQFGEILDERVVEAEIKNTVIVNTSAAGIYSIGSDITLYNCVIGKTEFSSIVVLRGGNLNVNQCTFSNMFGKDPGLLLTNFVECTEEVCDTNAYLIEQDLNAYFYNSIVYGNNKDGELVVVKRNGGLSNYKFDHCLVKLNEDSFDIQNTELFNEIILNRNPKLVNHADDFSLDTLSPAKDAGSYDLINGILDLAVDIEGNSRLDDVAPDLGAYERIE